MNKKTWVAVLSAGAVRDAQIFTGNPNDPDIAYSDDWVDAKRPELYLGIVTGTDEASVKKTVADREGVFPEVVVLYEVAAGVDGHRKFSLRQKVDEAMTGYKARYGDELDWHWHDEGLPWAIQDYHSCIGSVLDFTEDDWSVCAEHGWTKAEVCFLCEDKAD